MAISCFDFIVDFDEELSSNCIEVEKFFVNGEYKSVIEKCSEIANSITKEVSKKEGFNNYLNFSESERLKELGKMGIIRFDNQRPFDDIRRMNASLDDLDSEQLFLFSRKAHKLLFNIVSWYFEKFNEDLSFDDVEIIYRLPDSSNIEPSVEQNIDFENQFDQKDRKEIIENQFVDYKGSYLWGCIKNLEKGSMESVEGNNLSKFKNYLHVTRSIHEDFSNEVKRVMDKESPHLIIVCGSVGDGKSHLVGNLNQESEYLSNFEILGDGTESYDYDVDNLPTLANNLKNFNDTNINNPQNSKKFILAINLGILNNFIESEYSDNFNIFKEVIKKSKIFDKNIISQNYISDNDLISIISFTDYNLFELTDNEESNYVSSDYILNLFKKITVKSKENPFYEAYVKDKEYIEKYPEKKFENNLGLIVDNYEMFSKDFVQQIIIEYIIKISVKNRVIISSRELLDLIYNIIIPPKLINPDYFAHEYIEGSLPNLLFNSPQRSDLLRLFKNFDPISIRTEAIDEFIIKVNISSQLDEILNDYMNLSECKLLNYCVEQIDLRNSSSPVFQKKFTSTLIRFLLFFGNSEIKENFKDQTYLDFLRYLYHFNLQNHFSYINLFDEVKKAISKRNGSKIDLLCVNSLEHFKIFKNLNLKPKSCEVDEDNFKCFKDEDNRILNRFKTEITIKFKINNEIYSSPLNIDFSLYEYITKINNGYKPNKSDKEDLKVFDEFINYLINVKNSDEMIIEKLDSNKVLKFEYNEDLGGYFLG